MLGYLIRRLLLLPLTLFFIVLANFVIINLAPGEPTTLTEVSATGDASRSEEHANSESEDQYLQFREHYGLTLPILLNTWPWLSREDVLQNLTLLADYETSPQPQLTTKEYQKLRIQVGDQARYTMAPLLSLAQEEKQPLLLRRLAVRYFIRGGTQQAFLGPNLTEEEKRWNRKVAQENRFLQKQRIKTASLPSSIKEKVDLLQQWFENNKESYRYNPTKGERTSILFKETRFWRYLSRVFRLDFGSLRNDKNKTVINEVSKRFRFSLTLALTPMLITFILCQCFGFLMALKQNRWPDLSLNILFLILYATPVFVVAPFLIEKVALNHSFLFTETPIPISGFHSPDRIYETMTSKERLFDILQHLALPLIALTYGGLATQSRLSRTAILEVLRQDYVRTAFAKGLHPFTVLWKHVGRNAAITIVTSLAGSLGVILGGSLIIETIFGINGFGRFFYDAILNRDYNVIMFSALAGSFLTLVGYLLADITYTFLDPRVTLD